MQEFFFKRVSWRASALQVATTKNFEDILTDQSIRSTFLE
jgi:hypothetical protein